MRIDNQIVQEADVLAKETGIDFRVWLEILCRAFLTQKSEKSLTTV